MRTGDLFDVIVGRFSPLLQSSSCRVCLSLRTVPRHELPAVTTMGRVGGQNHPGQVWQSNFDTHVISRVARERSPFQAISPAMTSAAVATLVLAATAAGTWVVTPDGRREADTLTSRCDVVVLEVMPYPDAIVQRPIGMIEEPLRYPIGHIEVALLRDPHIRQMNGGLLRAVPRAKQQRACGSSGIRIS